MHRRAQVAQEAHASVPFFVCPSDGGLSLDCGILIVHAIRCLPMHCMPRTVYCMYTICWYANALSMFSCTHYQYAMY